MSFHYLRKPIFFTYAVHDILISTVENSVRDLGFHLSSTLYTPYRKIQLKGF